MQGQIRNWVSKLYQNPIYIFSGNMLPEPHGKASGIIMKTRRNIPLFFYQLYILTTNFEAAARTARVSS